MNKNVDKASIFAIPAEGLMFGVIWIWQEAHNDASQSIWEFSVTCLRDTSEENILKYIERQKNCQL